MPITVKIGNRASKVEILEQKLNEYTIRIDERLYQIDLAKVEQGVYSLLYNGKSINMEMIEGDKPNQYFVNTRNNGYHIEVVDARARYRAMANDSLQTDNIILSPMPGKIVRIPVKKGDSVQRGDIVIVVSAMKMESEYKSPADGVIKKVNVQEGDTIEGNQVLVEIE